MTEETKTDETKTEEEKKAKGVLGKLQEITPDKDEQVALIGVAVRLGIVVWSGFILTLAYVDLPGFQKQNFDPTFIASVFTGALSTFGLATAKDKKNGNGVTKEDMEAMIAKSNTAQTEQIIRVQTPLTINGAEVVKTDSITNKPVSAPGSVVTRQANEYSISGNGIATTDGTTDDVLGGLGAATSGVNSVTFITPSQLEEGQAFSFVNSYTEGDSIESSIDTGSIPAYSNLTSTSAGDGGDAEIGVGQDGALTLSIGTATGTTITGQFTTTLEVD